MRKKHINLKTLVPDYIKGFQAYIPSKPDDILMEIYNCKKVIQVK